MGKKNDQKEAVRAQAPKDQHTRSVAMYFSRNSEEKLLGLATESERIMAAEQADMEATDDATTKADVYSLEAVIVDKLSAKIADLIKPIQTQLDNIKSAVAETKKTADCAMQLALATQEGSKALQYDQENLKHKILTLEMEEKMLNVKIHGFPENTEATVDLQVFISTWMSSVLKVEDNIAPCLTRVWRLGEPGNTKQQGPHDILATFLYERVKIALIREVRHQGSLYYEGERIKIYQDLPSEALLLRMEHKLITQQLHSANQRYSWIGTAKCQVQQNGTSLTASDMESGLMVLHILGLQLSADASRRNIKRKLDLSTSPLKGSKILIRSLL